MELEFGNHNLSILTKETTLVSLNGNPSNVLSAGRHTVKLRQFAGKVEFDTTGKNKPTVTVRSKLSQPGEKVDDLPPPPPPAADNFLQKMRLKVRQEMGVNREAFAAHRSPYEAGYDGDFEEDVLEALKETPPEEVTEIVQDDPKEENQSVSDEGKSV